MVPQLKYLLLISGIALAFAWRMKEESPAARPAPDAAGPENPVELGSVHWMRNPDSAFALSQKNHKPVLILFQEVPGCSNCTRFGSSTLSHPLIVEAIEDLFVPLCIYNNKKGKDAEMLDRFGEPAWNNPVVRIVNTAGKDLTDRMPDFRSQSAVVTGMKQALEKAGTSVPNYLQLVIDELSAKDSGVDTATYSMYCFWSGEGTFGAIDGVIETEPGFQDGKEVVKVIYDARKIQKTALDELASPKGIQTCSKNTGFRSDKEPKYYLSGTNWKYVPMTTLQACRANSLAGQGQSPEPVLSPRQIALYQGLQQGTIRKKTSAIGQKDLAKAWTTAKAR